LGGGFTIPQLSHSTVRARAQAAPSSPRSSASKSKSDSRAKIDSRKHSSSKAKSASPDGKHAAEQEFERLENVVRALVEAHQDELVRNEALRNDLDEKNHRIRQLETKLLDVNQRRQDVAKRIDELIAQIDQLDVQLADSAADPS